LGLSVPNTAAATITRGFRASASTTPAAVMRNAEKRRTLRRPMRCAREATAMVKTASSTRVPVKTAPMAGAESPRRSRYRARMSDSHPNPKVRRARPAKSRRPSGLRYTDIG
jgi:hypothetical protein